jgi:hypothetical protein
MKRKTTVAPQNAAKTRRLSESEGSTVIKTIKTNFIEEQKEKARKWAEMNLPNSAIKSKKSQLLDKTNSSPSLTSSSKKSSSTRYEKSSSSSSVQKSNKTNNEVSLNVLNI